jgi:hypothetical protein
VQEKHNSHNEPFEGGTENRSATYIQSCQNLEPSLEKASQPNNNVSTFQQITLYTLHCFRILKRPSVNIFKHPVL